MAFVIAKNPGVYPNVPASAKTAQWERLVTELKAEVAEYEKCLGVTNALKLKICEAVESMYLKEIKHLLLIFDKINANKNMQHLQDQGGDLDYKDITALKKSVAVNGIMATNTL